MWNIISQPKLLMMLFKAKGTKNDEAGEPIVGASASVYQI